MDLLSELLEALQRPPSHARERKLARLFTADVRGSSPEQTLVGAAWWTRVPSFPRVDGASVLQVRFADRSGDRAALIFDALDLRTGESTRHAWAMTIVDDRVRRIATSAVAVRHDPPKVTAPAPDSLAWLEARFGLRRWAGDDGGMTLAEAMARAAAEVQPLPEPDGEVLGNAHLFLLPIAWIGCSGLLVERATGRLHVLGSAFGAGVHVWAWYRGFAEGPTRDQRPNTLRVAAVRDPARLEAVVARLYPAVGEGPVVAQPGPRYEGVDLYFLRGELRDVEATGAFDFEVTGAELRPPVP